VARGRDNFRVGDDKPQGPPSLANPLCRAQLKLTMRKSEFRFGTSWYNPVYSGLFGTVLLIVVVLYLVGGLRL
jgi:hypothetical protein